MKVFEFQAALLCEDCGESIKAQLPDVSEDSDDFPQGPYSNGGGEADSPQHCDACAVFLDNPLTPDGERYCLEQWEEYCTSGVGNPGVLFEWLTAYPWVWAYFRENLAAEQQGVADYLESAVWAA